MASNPTEQESLRSRMQREPGALLEKVADEYGVSTLEVARHLPAAHCTLVAGDALGTILESLTEWGKVMFIVHTPSFIVEVSTAIPAAKRARGYFNFHGDFPLGGHLREDACQEIAFIDRPFMGRRSASVQCFDYDGNSIFKVFVARDETRELLPEQLARFEALRERFQS